MRRKYLLKSQSIQSYLSQFAERRIINGREYEQTYRNLKARHDAEEAGEELPRILYAYPGRQSLTETEIKSRTRVAKKEMLPMFIVKNGMKNKPGAPLVNQNNKLPSQGRLTEEKYV